MRRFFLTLLLLALVVTGCRRSSELPLLYTLPQVTLVNEKGATVPLDAIKGKVAVYDFIFTRCPGTCPVLTRQMRKLTEKFEADDAVRFVSLSVDPVNDTPAVLSAYAAQNRNDARWILLTGAHDAVRRLSVEGFKLAATDGGSKTEPIVHSTKFVLVDKSGVIRAYYDAMDDAALEQIVRDARRLAEES